jgi:hypothetical protein
MDFVFAQAPRGLDDCQLIREQINWKSYHAPVHEVCIACES